MGYTPFPASVPVLCRYVAYLTDRLKAVSIPKYLSILKVVHLEMGLPDPLAHNWTLQSLLKGVKRDMGVAPQQKLAITPEILLKLYSVLKLSCPLDMVFWAACVVAFFGLFRKSNLLPVSASTWGHCLTNNDVTYHRSYKCVILQISHTKTIQLGQRRLQVPLPFLPNHPLCPVTALTAVLVQAPTQGSCLPLFTINTPQGAHILTQSIFQRRLASALTKIGLSPSAYSGHSFRRGGATWALQAGVPGEVIQMMGDWRSEAYKVYLETNLHTKHTFMARFASALPTSL